MVDFRKRTDHRAEMNLTPLIDVIFILLIFFMISTQFKQARLSLDLPEVGGTPERASSEEILLLGIDREGVLHFRGAPLEQSELEGVLQGALRKNPEVPLILDCHKDIPIERVLNLLAGLRGAGVKNISFRYEPIRP